MTPKVGEVWLFHGVAAEVLFLLIRENKHGSFDVLYLEDGKEGWLHRNWKVGTKVGEWERFA